MTGIAQLNELQRLTVLYASGGEPFPATSPVVGVTQAVFRAALERGDVDMRFVVRDLREGVTLERAAIGTYSIGLEDLLFAAKRRVSREVFSDCLRWGLGSQEPPQSLFQAVLRLRSPVLDYLRRLILQGYMVDQEDFRLAVDLQRSYEVFWVLLNCNAERDEDGGVVLVEHDEGYIPCPDDYEYACQRRLPTGILELIDLHVEEWGSGSEPELSEPEA